MHDGSNGLRLGGEFFGGDAVCLLTAIVGFVNRALDQRRGVLGGLRATLRQIANLIGNHSKPHARFSGARCFNCSVQRKQVGLECDLVDDLDDQSDRPNRPQTVAVSGEMTGEGAHELSCLPAIDTMGRIGADATPVSSSGLSE